MELREQKERVTETLSRLQAWIVWAVLAVIIYVGYTIRIKNLPLLRDLYPADPDAFLFLRYTKYVAEQGALPAVDYLRNYPLGFPMEVEAPLLPYTIAYLYKVLHFFSPSMTVEKADLLYPPIAFAIGLVFFFLLIRRVFNNWTALLATAFLAVVPSFLHRTLAGVSDKEALFMMLLFLALYLFVRAWQAPSWKGAVLFGGLAGLATGLGGLASGLVNFIFLAVGLMAFLVILFGWSQPIQLYAYLAWMGVLLPVLFTSRFNLLSLATSFTTMFMMLATAMAIVELLLFHADVLKRRAWLGTLLPRGLLVFLVALALGLLPILVSNPTFLFTKPLGIYQSVFQPFGDRWATTVAESHEPYIITWIQSNFGWQYLLVFIFGSVLLFYEMVKPVKKYAWMLTFLYLVFIFPFIFSRYSPEAAILNGVTQTSKFLYMGGFLLFFGLMIALVFYSYYTKREVYEAAKSIRGEYLLLLLLFIVMVMGARRNIRLIFVFSPATAYMAALFFSKLAEYSRWLKQDYLKIGVYAVLLIVAGLMLQDFAEAITAQASSAGPGFNTQWQNAASWVKENTPKEAVFAHWWDYGYWVQTGWDRATITDGGNAIGYWNHLMGRHVLLGHSDREALEFLYAHNASYLLIVSEEIGKFPAFSLIGADENFDRYSSIGVFALDKENVQETRNSTVFLYRGGIALDEDFILNGQLFPKQAAGIGAIFLPVKEEGGSIEMFPPRAVLVYNGQQVQVPVECVVFEGKELLFEASNGLKGCLRIIPTWEGPTQANRVGGLLYVSEKNRKTRFAQLYLFERLSPFFELAYTDNVPLSLLNGRIIGPLKIWKVTYPDDIEFKEEYAQTAWVNTDVAKL